MQDFESESPTTGGEHSQKVKAPPVVGDYGSKDCVNLPSSTAVSRLKFKSEFRLVCQEGNLFSSERIHVYFRSVPGRARLGITASKKFGKAHERNRFKRLVREAFRALDIHDVEIVVKPRAKAKEAKMQDVLADFQCAVSISEMDACISSLSKSGALT